VRTVELAGGRLIAAIEARHRRDVKRVALLVLDEVVEQVERAVALAVAGADLERQRRGAAEP
jgi:hypothetical protein